MKLSRRREFEPSYSQLGRFDPFGALQTMLGWDPFRQLEPFAGRTGRGFVPDIEVKETKDAYVFKADVPGLSNEDVDISVTGNTLTISGKREEEEEQEGEKYYAYERSYGAFSRSFTLPAGCNAEQVNAELKEGVLTVSVPKMPEVQAKRIAVQAGAGGGAGKVEPGKVEPGMVEPGKMEGGKEKKKTAA